MWHLCAASAIHAEVSQVLSLISKKVCTSTLNSSCHVLPEVTSHQPRILDFVREVELKMGIVQFSGETVAENQFLYRQQTKSFDVFISQILSSI